jgi:hypothetical protein
MPDRNRTVSADRTPVIGALRALWWPLWLAFAALTVRLGIERGCRDPYDLLPAVVSNPAWAWPLALVYVAAHGWMAAAYLVTVASAGSVVPGWRTWRETWGRSVAMVLLMLAALAIEYAPGPLWRMVMAAAGCGG